MKRTKIYFLFILMIAFVVSCKKDAPPVLPQQANIPLSTDKRLLICDEGNFGQSNAGISIYDPVSNAVIISAFATANPGYTLGDVAQSIGKFNNKYYAVVNNSGKIVVCNNNLTKLSVITGFISPRYIQFVSNNKAYVSNLQLSPTQPNYIQVVDLTTNSIIKNIRLDGWSEEMLSSYGNVYVTNQDKKYVYVINTEHDAITDSIYVRGTTAHIVKDENEEIWVSCNADAGNNISSRLVKIDPVSNTLQDSVSLNTTQNSISRLCINGTGTTLYYLMNDVFKMSITATSGTDIIQQGNHTFYGLCVDPDDETIYVSDAGDYNSNGKLLRHQPSGTVTGTYTVGVIPGFMLMDSN
jgi:DNA-binding beta-propeller fold protein YncE